MAKAARRRYREGMEDIPPLNCEQRRILNWLKRLHFKRSLFGVSERDVWRKLEELNNMYNAALNAERARYDALIEQERRGVNTDAGDNGGER